MADGRGAGRNAARRSVSNNLLTCLRERFELDWQGIHGAPHWARLRANGLRLAGMTGANPQVVELFAFLHDARREHDGDDPGHGQRAADLATALRGDLFELPDAEFTLLLQACSGHSRGWTTGADITVLTCWDADRLDLGRLGPGYYPDPQRLCTEAARDPDVIEWAYLRSAHQAFAGRI